MTDNPLWVEKYRPKTVADTILPASLKATFQQFVDQNSIPNITLSGPPGVGKTTIARAMLEQLECDYIVINGSMNGNIDTLRNEIMNFASSVSLAGGRKYVILDEADYLNPNSTQPALRNFMEEYSNNCGFILTVNFKNRIIAPLHSRCPPIDFAISREDRPKMAAQFMRRAVEILTAESVEFDKAAVAAVVQKYFPDWRRALNELQRYSVTGKIDSGILADLKESTIKDLIPLLKDKQFTEIRKWVAENSDQDQNAIYRKLYDRASEILKPNSVPLLVLAIAKYSYQGAFAADPEINMMACFTEIMLECEFQ
jgi:DNA polymerase III delta prime subunit